jgi:hypothetical protein
MLLRESFLFEVYVFNLVFSDHLSQLLHMIRRYIIAFLVSFQLFNLPNQFLIGLPDFFDSLMIVLAAMSGELRFLILL